MAYPFAFSRALDEMGSFRVFEAAAHGGAWTNFWSACIVVRALALLALAYDMLQFPEPVRAQAQRVEPARATPASADVAHSSST